MEAKKGSVSVVLIILAAVLLGSGYYFLIYRPNHQTVVDTTTQANQPLVGGDKDSHGCIGSAGYSWCSLKNKCLRVWEEPCDEQVTPVDETQDIITAVKAAIIAKRGTGAADLTYTVSKIQGDFAQGGASGQGGGAMWFAAKVNNTWKLVWDGNGVILCSDIAAYPFPTSMIPECYNDATKTSVKR